MKMTSIIIYYGYTYFGLPDIDEKKEGYFYSYAKVDDSDEKIDDSDRDQKSVPEVSSRSQFQKPLGLPSSPIASSQ
jgi:hypothetical protein